MRDNLIEEESMLVSFTDILFISYKDRQEYVSAEMARFYLSEGVHDQKDAQRQLTINLADLNIKFTKANKYKDNKIMLYFERDKKINVEVKKYE